MKSTEQIQEELNLSMIVRKWTKVQIYEAYLLENRARLEAEENLKRVNIILAKIRFDSRM